MALTFLSDRSSTDLTILPSGCSANVGFPQFQKFDLKFETEIVIRSKCWNFSFCGLFFFFSCSFRLSLVTDIKTRLQNLQKKY